MEIPGDSYARGDYDRKRFREGNMPARSTNVATENAHAGLTEHGVLKVEWYATALLKATVAKIADISKSDRSLPCPDNSSS